MALTSIRMDRNVPMEMRDNTILRADIYRPLDDGKHPVILIRTPYNKLLSGGQDSLNVADAAHAGYGIVIQDIRGRFASDGAWETGAMYFREGKDGYDSVEWIAAQPWCDGNVGTAGGSYLAALQWVLAQENPPHLKAMAPWIGNSSTEEELELTGGATNLYIAASWVPVMAVDVADRLAKEGEDVTAMRSAIMDTLYNPEKLYGHLPLRDAPLARYDALRPLLAGQLSGGPPNRNIIELARRHYEKVMVPCQHVSGWYDIFTWATFHNFNQMRLHGGAEVARKGQHVIMGPWIHGARLLAFWGQLNFGALAGEPAAMVSVQTLAFFDRYLRGKNVPIPPVHYFVMGENRWHDAESWPIPGTSWQRFYMHSKGRANTAAGDGLLDSRMPGEEFQDCFAYNPLNPVPTTGGRYLPLAGLVPGPIDQSHIEKRPDVLCYTTPELTSDVEVTGPIAIHLFAATSAVDTDFVAKLIDVWPDGRAINIAEGIKRARGRKSVFSPQPLTPGEINEFIIDMGNTSQLFRSGHRIRIDVTSSAFPQWDRNMNTGNSIGEDAKGVPALQTIHHSSQYASYADLPVILRQ